MYITWNKGDKISITEHFTSLELQCNCSYSDCVEQRISLEHIEKLEEKRVKWGKPIKINSGFRCEKHNKAEGGSPKSQHLYGNATDITVKGMTPQEVANDCEDFNGLGRYATFTHVDSRMGKARW